MRVLFLEPYYGGSHRAFADGWQRHSRHEVIIRSLPARKWKWRMQAGAVQFAEMLRGEAAPADACEVLFVTSMLSLAEFRGLAPAGIRQLPAALYFHENQFGYPSRAGNAEFHWGFTQLTASLSAEQVLFNSSYNRDNFLTHVAKGMGHVPDLGEGAAWVERVSRKTAVIPPGVDVGRFARDSGEGADGAGRGDVAETSRAVGDPPLLVWNHRWEHDKGPETFFKVLRDLASAGAGFRVAVCGERFERTPDCFDEARERLGEHIEHWGYLESCEDYARLLQRADIAVSTARHEFFGVSTVEALAAGCDVLLPARLNYPSLLPPVSHRRCLYRSRSDLVRKLKARLERPETIQPAAEAEWLAQFSWPVVAARLDAVVADLADRGRQ